VHTTRVTRVSCRRLHCIVLGKAGHHLVPNVCRKDAAGRSGRGGRRVRHAAVPRRGQGCERAVASGAEEGVEGHRSEEALHQCLAGKVNRHEQQQFEGTRSELLCR